MTLDWTDLQLAVAERDLVFLLGIPSCSPADYFWVGGDLAGWLDAACKVRAGIVYAAEVTVAEQIYGLRERLIMLRDEVFDDSFDAEADQLELWLADILDRGGDDVIGWIGEWRYGGVSHHYAVIDVPEPLRAIGARLEAHAAVLGSASEQRGLHFSLVDEPREAASQARQEQSDIDQ